MVRRLEWWEKTSTVREVSRAKYAHYMRSAAWFNRRRKWLRDEQARTGHTQVYCVGGCENKWTLNDDLHHATYARFGDEAHEDLWPMCRFCHSWIHQEIRGNRSYRKLADYTASSAALQLLRTEWEKLRGSSLQDTNQQ